jgi:hypothetical protein
MEEPQATMDGITDDASIPLTPPEGSLRVTPDGTVLKHVLQPGAGDKPPLHARCLGAQPPGDPGGHSCGTRLTSGCL